LGSANQRLAGFGASLATLLVIAWTLGAKPTPPVQTVAMLLGNSARLVQPA